MVSFATVRPLSPAHEGVERDGRGEALHKRASGDLLSGRRRRLVELTRQQSRADQLQQQSAAATDPLREVVSVHPRSVVWSAALDAADSSSLQAGGYGFESRWLHLFACCQTALSVAPDAESDGRYSYGDSSGRQGRWPLRLVYLVSVNCIDINETG
jgi:hypothetical protein